MTEIMQIPGFWILVGFIAALIVKTFGPWLRLKPRPAFDRKFLIEPIVTAVVALYPSLAILPRCNVWWADIPLGAAIAYIGQDVIRAYITKPREVNS